MRLYLGAHAACVSSAENLRQPLSAQGRLDVTHVAGFLSLFHQPSPAIVWHSNRLAAIQTAEMIREAWQAEQCQQHRLLAPEADVQALHATICKQTEDSVWIGHTTSLQALVARLLGCTHEPCALTDGSMLCLQQQDEDNWQLQWSLSPQLFYRTD